MGYSKHGYKRNSKDRNNPYNIIPSGNITMEGVDFPVMGTDNFGNQQLMMPGANYTFPGNSVFEIPLAQTGGEENKHPFVKWAEEQGVSPSEAYKKILANPEQFDNQLVSAAKDYAVETNKWNKVNDKNDQRLIPKAQMGNSEQEEIINVNKDVSEWNKEYVQSANFRDMLKAAGLNDNEIDQRINAVLNFNVNTDITFDEENPSLGSMYNTSHTTSGGWNIPMTTFPGQGEDMINYNPDMMLEHTMYGPPNQGGGWPAVSSHEQGHLLGSGGLNKKTTKALKKIAKENKKYLKSFSGGNKKAYRHAKDPEEMRANLLQLRYQMENAGLYESTKGDYENIPFNIEDLKKIIEFDEDGRFKKYKSEFNNELLETIPPDEIIWMMNNIADNSTMPVDMVQYGGSNPAYQKGGSLPKFQDVGEFNLEPTSSVQDQIFNQTQQIQINQDAQEFQVQQFNDLEELDDWDFKDKYGTSKHAIKMSINPEYAAGFQGRGDIGGGTVKSYYDQFKGNNPNEQWISGASNQMYASPEQKEQTQNFHTNVIGAALPIPGIEAINLGYKGSKLPGIFNSTFKSVKPGFTNPKIDPDDFHRQWYNSPEYLKSVKNRSVGVYKDFNDRLVNNPVSGLDWRLANKSGDPLAKKFSYQDYLTGNIPEGKYIDNITNKPVTGNIFSKFPIHQKAAGVNPAMFDPSNIPVNTYGDILKTDLKGATTIGGKANAVTDYLHKSITTGGLAGMKLKIKNLKKFAPEFKLNNGLTNSPITGDIQMSNAIQRFNSSNKGLKGTDYGSTLVHERSHILDGSGMVYPPHVNKQFENAIDPNYNSWMGKLGEKTGIKAGYGNINMLNMKPYYANETEQMARMMQERARLGLKPSDKYTLDMFNENKNMFGMGDYLAKDKSGNPSVFINNMNSIKQDGGSLPKAQTGFGSSLYRLAADPNYKWKDALYDNTLKPISHALDVLSVPGALIAEAGEYFDERGDKEFNFTDALPGFKGDYSFQNMHGEDMKTLAGTTDEFGNPLVENPWGAFALNVLTDPSTYVGAGLIKSGVKKGVQKTAPIIKNIIGKGKDKVVKTVTGKVPALTQDGVKYTKPGNIQKVYRAEDAATINNPATTDYEIGNWVGTKSGTPFGSDPNFYINKTKKFGTQGSKMLGDDEARRIMQFDIDKNFWNKISHENMPLDARTISGGPNVPYLHGEGIMPPHIMNQARNNKGYGNFFQTHILKSKEDAIKKMGDLKYGGDLPQAQWGALGQLIKQGVKQVPRYMDDLFKSGKKFDSEIDWGTFNKSIPENKILMQEYNLIEETAKANKTWMKNADGSAFKGTPEQFVQSKSGNFKAAYPEGYESVYRGVPGEDIAEYGPLGHKPHVGTGIFTADPKVAKNYSWSSGSANREGHTLNLAMRNSDNSLRIEGLGSWHANLHTIGSSKKILKKNIDKLKKDIVSQNAINKKFGRGPEVPKMNASNLPARLESYENFYNNYDKIVSNPVYKKLLKHKEEVLKAGQKTKTAPGSNSYSTDDLALFLEREGLDNIQLKFVDDGRMGSTNIHNQVSGNYLKNLEGNSGMFDLTNPNIYKQEGGSINVPEIEPMIQDNTIVQMPNKPEIIIDEVKTNKPKLDLNNIMNYIIETRGGDTDLWSGAADSIAYHESGPEQRMDPKAIQISQRSDGTFYDGPGRGMFQFEPSSLKTAQTRYKNVADATGLIVDEDILKATDATHLSKENQYALFLTNLIESNAVLKDYTDGKLSLEDLWLQGHKNKEVEGNRKSFKESMNDAKDKGIENGYADFTLEDLLIKKTGGEYMRKMKRLNQQLKLYNSGGAISPIAKKALKKLGRIKSRVINYNDLTDLNELVPAASGYEVKEGDTLDSIAKDNKISKEILLNYNPKYRGDLSKINIGDNIRLNLVLSELEVGGEFNIDRQTRFYEEYIDGLYKETKQDEQSNNIFNKLNRLYYNDSKLNNIHQLDYMRQVRDQG